MVGRELPGHGGPTSPYVYFTRDANGAVISATFPFDTTTHALLPGAFAHRDAGCSYTQLVIGDPAAPIHTVNLTGLTGDRTFTLSQLHNVGLDTYDDVTSTQITAIV